MKKHNELHEKRIKKVMEIKKKQEKIIKIASGVLFSLVLIYLTSTMTLAFNRKYETVTVKKGQTLWQIAEEYTNGKDIRKFIKQVSSANGINPDNIVSGQELVIPIS